MKNDYSNIEISQKHVKLRVVAFIVAAVIAIGAITYGVTHLGAKEPGWYEVESNGEASTIRMGRELRFRYRFSGKSQAINLELKELREVYTAALKRCGELLDPVDRYSGVVNLAALNQSVGVDLHVDPALLPVLQDALERTARGEGYSLFAGALYAEWNSIVNLADPQDFDPLRNRDEWARLLTAQSLASEPEAFSLTVVDAERAIVRLDAADWALEALEDMELSGRILDLNLLRDAYLIRLLAAELEEKGYHKGYLIADSGVLWTLSECETVAGTLYGLGEDGPLPAATALLGSEEAYCAWHAFATEDGAYGWYQIEDEAGETLLRHPYLRADLTLSDKLRSVAVKAADPVEAACRALRLISAADGSEAAALADGWPAAWTLAGEEGLVYFSEQAEAAGFNDDGGYGWRRA
ncbi:MAG: hypothetical protein IJR65_08265 [Oscillospiraceae bacterium]|nr:hypothetical protein [Oscillospiraceae bacterium]